MSEKTSNTREPTPLDQAGLKRIEEASIAAGIARVNRERDAKNASTLLNLLANVPMQATFGDIDKVANETLEVRNWLEEMAESQD